MAAGCAGCKILDEETTDRLNDLGERMKQMVQDVIDKHVYSEVPHMNGHDSRQLFNGEENTTQPQHSDTVPKMWISGIGSILAIHFASSSMQSTLQSLYYHHTLYRGYISRRVWVYGPQYRNGFGTRAGPCRRNRSVRREIQRFDTWCLVVSLWPLGSEAGGTEHDRAKVKVQTTRWSRY